MKDFRTIARILVAETILIAVADQITKFWVRQTLSPDEPVVVIPGLFNLVHWRNTGIAFGLLQDQSVLLTLLGTAALVGIPLLFWWEWRRDARLGVAAWGLGLILGGALGNLIDRLRFGDVTDFLLFYIGSRQWPAFNLADSGITIGTILVLFLAYRSSSKGEPQPQDNPTRQDENALKDQRAEDKA